MMKIIKVLLLLLTVTTTIDGSKESQRAAVDRRSTSISLIFKQFSQNAQKQPLQTGYSNFKVFGFWKKYPGKGTFAKNLDTFSSRVIPRGPASLNNSPGVSNFSFKLKGIKSRRSGFLQRIEMFPIPWKQIYFKPYPKSNQERFFVDSILDPDLHKVKLSNSETTESENFSRTITTVGQVPFREGLVKFLAKKRIDNPPIVRYDLQWKPSLGAKDSGPVKVAKEIPRRTMKVSQQLENFRFLKRYLKLGKLVLPKSEKQFVFSSQKRRVKEKFVNALQWTKILLPPTWTRDSQFRPTDQPPRDEEGRSGTDALKSVKANGSSRFVRKKWRFSRLWRMMQQFAVPVVQVTYFGIPWKQIPASFFILKPMPVNLRSYRISSARKFSFLNKAKRFLTKSRRRLSRKRRQIGQSPIYKSVFDDNSQSKSLSHRFFEGSRRDAVNVTSFKFLGKYCNLSDQFQVPRVNKNVNFHQYIYRQNGNHAYQYQIAELSKSHFLNDLKFVRFNKSNSEASRYYDYYLQRKVFFAPQKTIKESQSMKLQIPDKNKSVHFQNHQGNITLKKKIAGQTGFRNGSSTRWDASAASKRTNSTFTFNPTIEYFPVSKKPFRPILLLSNKYGIYPTLHVNNTKPIQKPSSSVENLHNSSQFAHGYILPLSRKSKTFVTPQTFPYFKPFNHFSHVVTNEGNSKIKLALKGNDTEKTSFLYLRPRKPYHPAIYPIFRPVDIRPQWAIKSNIVEQNQVKEINKTAAKFLVRPSNFEKGEFLEPSIDLVSYYSAFPKGPQLIATAPKYVRLLVPNIIKHHQFVPFPTLKHFITFKSQHFLPKPYLLHKFRSDSENLSENSENVSSSPSPKSISLFSNLVSKNQPSRRVEGKVFKQDSVKKNESKPLQTQNEMFLPNQTKTHKFIETSHLSQTPFKQSKPDKENFKNLVVSTLKKHTLLPQPIIIDTKFKSFSSQVLPETNSLQNLGLLFNKSESVNIGKTLYTNPLLPKVNLTNGFLPKKLTLVVSTPQVQTVLPIVEKEVSFLETPHVKLLPNQTKTHKLVEILQLPQTSFATIFKPLKHLNVRKNLVVSTLKNQKISPDSRLLSKVKYYSTNSSKVIDSEKSTGVLQNLSSAPNTNEKLLFLDKLFMPKINSTKDFLTENVNSVMQLAVPALLPIATKKVSFEESQHSNVARPHKFLETLHLTQTNFATTFKDLNPHKKSVKNLVTSTLKSQTVKSRSNREPLELKSDKAESKKEKMPLSRRRLPKVNLTNNFVTQPNLKLPSLNTTSTLTKSVTESNKFRLNSNVTTKKQNLTSIVIAKASQNQIIVPEKTVVVDSANINASHDEISGNHKSGNRPKNIVVSWLKNESFNLNSKEIESSLKATSRTDFAINEKAIQESLLKNSIDNNNNNNNNITANNSVINNVNSSSNSIIRKSEIVVNNSNDENINTMIINKASPKNLEGHFNTISSTVVENITKKPGNQKILLKVIKRPVVKSSFKNAPFTFDSKESNDNDSLLNLNTSDSGTDTTKTIKKIDPPIKRRVIYIENNRADIPIEEVSVDINNDDNDKLVDVSPVPLY